MDKNERNNEVYPGTEDEALTTPQGEEAVAATTETEADTEADTAAEVDAQAADAAADGETQAAAWEGGAGQADETEVIAQQDHAATGYYQPLQGGYYAQPLAQPGVATPASAAAAPASRPWYRRTKWQVVAALAVGIPLVFGTGLAVGAAATGGHGPHGGWHQGDAGRGQENGGKAGKAGKHGRGEGGRGERDCPRQMQGFDNFQGNGQGYGPGNGQGYGLGNGQGMNQPGNGQGMNQPGNQQGMNQPGNQPNNQPNNQPGTGLGQNETTPNQGGQQ